MNKKILNNLCDEIYQVLYNHKCDEIIYDEIGKLIDVCKAKLDEPNKK